MNNNKKKTYAVLFSIFLLTTLFSWTLCADEPLTYTIVIDPGHGGSINRRMDDKWDARSKTYLDYYNTGMIAGEFQEYQVVLGLSKRIKHYLDLTSSDEGWMEFEKILKEMSPQKEFKRIKLSAHMTREDSWENRSSDPLKIELNAPYRHYDFPDPETKKMQFGRLSFINSLHPHLVVSIHMNPAGNGNPGGMAAVIAPGYDTFDTIRKIHLNQLPLSRFTKMEWSKYWLATDNGWTPYQSARADTWVYFHGYRTVQDGSKPWYQKNRGIRHNMVTWRYNDPPGWEEEARKQGSGQYAIKYSEFKAEGRYWDRERSKPEQWRREGGPLGIGGDNHYASDELLRFIQYGVRVLEPEMNTRKAIGPILNPFVSTYGLPTFINAISAYLEVGHLNRMRDRKLVMEHTDQMAKSIAVGIYSLFRGIETRKGYGPYRPAGKKLDFNKYETLTEGNYFTIVDQPPASN